MSNIEGPEFTFNEHNVEDEHGDVVHKYFRQQQKKVEKFSNEEEKMAYMQEVFKLIKFSRIYQKRVFAEVEHGEKFKEDHQENEEARKRLLKELKRRKNK